VSTSRSHATDATQFRLGGEHDLEVWQEIENYAVPDAMDEWYAADPVRTEAKEDLWRESSAYFEWGRPGSWGTGLSLP
jgi:hypothetical protein